MKNITLKGFTLELKVTSYSEAFVRKLFTNRALGENHGRTHLRSV